MKKIHVEEILKKKEENLPGPDRYQKKDTFGGHTGTVHYSMRKRLGHFDMELNRERKKPGPGFYNAEDLIGQGLVSSAAKSAA